MENNSLNHLDALKNLMSDSAEPVPNQKVLSKIQPADVAGLLDELSSHQKHVLWKLLGSKRTARVLAEADETEIKAFLKQTSIEALAEVIAAMPTDEAADLLEYAGTKVVESVLALQSVKHATNIRRLRKYQTDTAGGIMTTEFFSAGAPQRGTGGPGNN
jgi:magnesium transporter